MQAVQHIQKNMKKSLLWVIAALMAAAVIFPFWYMIVMSTASDADILSTNIHLLPTSLYFGNIVKALTQTMLVQQFVNTLIVAFGILVLQTVTSILAAFAFSFLDFKGKKVLFLICLSTMMMPAETTIISNYLNISEWHWLDTYQALIIPFAASALGIFLFRQYFMTMAKEIREAAMIDGCGDMRFLWQIAAPLAKPVISAFAVTSFISSWGMYMWPLLVTSKDEMRVVQVGINSLQDADSSLSIGVALAGIAIITLPSLLVFFFGHKQLVEGMMSGAVKG